METTIKTKSEQEAERQEMIMRAVPAIVNLDRSRVVRVYSGRPGCGCGCRGNYSESKSSITRVLKAMRENVTFANRAGVDKSEVFTDEYTSVAYVETDSRFYWAYLR